MIYECSSPHRVPHSNLSEVSRTEADNTQCSQAASPARALNTLGQSGLTG